MTTFVVSLFLPYTIEFVTTPPPDHETRQSRPALVSNVSTTNVAPLSLFGNLANPQPGTPAAADTEAFFSSLGADSPALVRSNVPVPKTLVRTESHVPEWGQAHTLNQPRSQPTSAPPSTILQYAKLQEDNIAKALKKITSLNAPSPRKFSRARTYSGGAWEISPAVQGNGVLARVMKTAAEKGFPEHVSWVGTLGFPTDTIPPARKSEILEKLECDHDALTIFIDDKDFDGLYNHYCKTILWPVFHYQIPDHPRSKAYQDHSWIHYVKVNEMFAERVIKSYKRGDTIWIHDYHLLLVPAMVRKKLPDAKIGLFLHTAFPSSEVFRCLAMRKQLLEGMLGANILAFQAHEYAHHFLTTCGRILVVEATEHGVQLENHYVSVTSIPIGIVPEQVLKDREDEEVMEWVKVLMKKYKDTRLIVARDKLDTIRGVKQKLLAYERFLKDNPDWREKVVLIQVALSSNEDKDLDSKISEIVSRIEGRYSTLAHHQPLVYLRQDISNAQYLALLTVADVLMVTPLRDGMNLTGHDYVICQDGKGTKDMPFQKKHGPLILSEFTGSARVFDGAELSINPWDIAQCAKAIKEALEMPEDQKDSRYESMLRSVEENNGEHWIHELTTRLDMAYESQQQRDTMSVPRLSINTVSEQYKSSSTRLFILDYEGTLAAWEAGKRTAMANPQRVVDTIISLISASDNNIVYVASGRTPEEMEHLFRAIPSVGLIAENGCFLRPFTADFEPEEWIDLADSVNSTTWKKDILNMLNFYIERIEGSSVEERNCSIIFSYADAKQEDLELASRQAGELTNHINETCLESRVRAVPVNMGVVIELSDHSKMTASSRILEIEKCRMTGIGRRRDSLIASLSQIREANGLGAPIIKMPSGYAESTISTSNGPKDDSPGRKYSSPGRKYSSFEHPDSAVSGIGYFGDKHVNHGHASPEPVSELQLPYTPNTLSHTPTSILDFLMVAGDNREDESLFHWANELAKEGLVKNVISVCVGKRNTTEARCTLAQGVTGLLNTLQKLAML